MYVPKNDLKSILSKFSLITSVDAAAPPEKPVKPGKAGENILFKRLEFGIQLNISRSL